MANGEPIRMEACDEGKIVRIILNRPKGNILNGEMVTALSRAVASEGGQQHVRALIIEGEGAHFSFGASVEEHLPDQVQNMLEVFHGLFRTLIEIRRPILAVVRGMCLGGGLELASFGHRVFCERSAVLGQPELSLGVLAPVASIVLPRRIGQAHTDDLLLTGRKVNAEEALAMGLCDELSEDATAAAIGWAREHLLPKSAASLAIAAGAARREFDRAFLAEIGNLEALYLEELMATHDAKEGIQAFLEKRPPVWKDL